MTELDVRASSNIRIGETLGGPSRDRAQAKAEKTSQLLKKLRTALGKVVDPSLQASTNNAVLNAIIQNS